MTSLLPGLGNRNSFIIRCKLNVGNRRVTPRSKIRPVRIEKQHLPIPLALLEGVALTRSRDVWSSDQREIAVNVRESRPIAAAGRIR
jgi:hypothetical protein